MYGLLGVAEDADVALIKTVHDTRKRSLEALPPGADRDNQIKFLDHAWQTLSDPAQRSVYDARLAQKRTVPADVKGKRSAGFGPMVWAAGFVVIALAVGLAIYFQRGSARPVNSSQIAQVTRPTPAAETKTTGTDAASTVLTPAQIFQLVSKSTVVVISQSNQEEALGSGVVIGNGEVVTNCHVALHAKNQLHILYDKHDYTATVHYSDRGHDLCQLSVPGLDAPTVEQARLADVNVGDHVVALGAPHGLSLTLSEGIVSALREHDGSSIIQTSAPISPGSSGGGLFDTRARLIGITTFQDSTGQNLNFAVPVDWIAQLSQRDGNADTLLPKGQHSRPQLTSVHSDPVYEQFADKLLGHWACRPEQPKSGLLSISFEFDDEGRFKSHRVNVNSQTMDAEGRYSIQSHTYVAMDWYGSILAMDVQSIDSIRATAVLNGGSGSFTVLCDHSRQ
ncbi:MAG: trypsin-like peptidase domain-containing protein [Burkholderiales bacterium]|nr:trypsin-like peptidase domain-containing protein [Burkholderiales bacterium]